MNKAVQGDAYIVTNILNELQLKFIKKELGFDKKAIANMTDDEISDMYDKMCDIEVEELTEDVLYEEKEESERCIIASDIVTVIGNALYSYDDGLKGDYLL